MKKSLLVLLLFVPQLIIAQEDVKNNKKGVSYLSLDARPAYVVTLTQKNPVNYFPKHLIGERNTYISDVKGLNTYDFFNSNHPVNITSLPQNLLGRTVNKEGRLAGLKTSQRYVFDMNNVLVDHEFSIQIGKKKRK